MPRDSEEDQQEAGRETGLLTSEPARRKGQDGEDSNEQEVCPGEPVADEKTERPPHRSQIRRVTVATSPFSRFSAARTDFLTGSK